jgi:hypothetical protein
LLPSLPTLECSMVDMAKRTFQKFFLCSYFVSCSFQCSTQHLYTHSLICYLFSLRSCNCVIAFRFLINWLLNIRTYLVFLITNDNAIMLGTPHSCEITAHVSNTSIIFESGYHNGQASPMLGSKRQWRYGTVCILTRPRRWGSVTATSKRLFVL